MITFDNFRLLKQIVKEDDNLLLLGSQDMNIPGALAEDAIYARDYLPAALECGVADVDINGEAMHNYDLTKYNAKKFEADVVADFGTTEHTDDPANVIRNVLAWAKDAAIFVNPSPDYEDPVNHGNTIRFTTEFWEALAEHIGANIALLDYKYAYALAEHAPETRVVLELAGASIPKKSEIQKLIDQYCKNV